MLYFGTFMANAYNRLMREKMVEIRKAEVDAFLMWCARRACYPCGGAITRGGDYQIFYLD